MKEISILTFGCGEIELAHRPGECDTELFGEGHELVLRTIDASSISSDRLFGLRVLATTNVSSSTVCMQSSNSLELTNGVVRVRELELTNGLRFFRSSKVRLIPLQP